MDRAQFMGQLAKLLSDISEIERQEALDYYESYFDDAGGENETEVIRELGSPGKVAAIIKADLRESNDRYAEYTELGYEDTRTKEPGQVPDKYTAVAARECKNSNDDNAGERKFGRKRAAQNGAYTGTHAGGQSSAYGPGDEQSKAHGSGDEQSKTYDSGDEQSRTYGSGGEQSRDYGADNGQSRTYGRGNQRSAGDRSASRAERGYHAEKKINKGGVILVLILLVFLSPFIKGAVGGVGGLIITIALFPFLLVFGLGVGALLLLVGALASVAAGIALCTTSPAIGILTMGIGCIVMAVGILFVTLLVWAAGKFIPWLLQTFTNFCHNILNRGKKGGADV